VYQAHVDTNLGIAGATPKARANMASEPARAMEAWAGDSYRDYPGTSRKRTKSLQWKRPLCAIGLNRYRDSAHFEVANQLIGQS